MKFIYMFKNWKTVVILTVFTLLGLGDHNLTVAAETAVINGNSVYVRSGPGTSYDSIGSLNKNTSINILERRDSWVKISYGDGSGWVAEFLTSHNPSTVRTISQYLLNGNPISFSANPVSVDGYTLVPLRETLENLGATVTWGGNQTITARKSTATVVLTIGSPAATVNGQVQNLEVPVQIKEGQAFAPLRFLVEALGGKTIWDEEDQLVNIYCPSNPQDPLTAVSITAADLNIRSGPSTSAEIIGMVPYGTILGYVTEQDGWYQVKYRGQLAWVASWLVIPLWNATVPSGGKEPTLLAVPSDHEAFVRQMKPFAETVNKGTGLPAALLLAQWAEESGYGTSALAQYYNNFGGIKDVDTGGFKKYSSPDEFAQDVIQVYTGHSKYERLLAHARDGAAMQTLVNDLSTSGYASSRGYGEKIRTVYLPEVNRILENMEES